MPAFRLLSEMPLSVGFLQFHAFNLYSVIGLPVPSSISENKTSFSLNSKLIFNSFPNKSTVSYFKSFLTAIKKHVLFFEALPFLKHLIIDM